MSDQNQVATTPTNPQKFDIRALLASPDIRAKVGEVLPKYLTAESITRVMLATIGRTPKLAQCTPNSLLNALMICASAGLPPDGRMAHLIPFKDQVQVIFDYKGLVMLAEKNGVQNIRAAVVCENDQFDFAVIDGVPKIEHRVDWRKGRGEMFAVYATCVRDGNIDVEVMQKEEVDAIRRRSQAGNSGPWVTDYAEMAKKTVLRRMSKRWPLSAEVAAALNSEADSIAAAPVSQVRVVPPVSFAAQLFGQADEEPDDIPMGDQAPVAPAASPAPRRGRPPKVAAPQPPPESEPQRQAPQEHPKPDLIPPQSDREKLVKLMGFNKIEEKAVLAFVFLATRTQFADLDDLDDATVNDLVANFATYSEQMDRTF